MEAKITNTNACVLSPHLMLKLMLMLVEVGVCFPLKKNTHKRQFRLPCTATDD